MISNYTTENLKTFNLDGTSNIWKSSGFLSNIRMKALCRLDAGPPGNDLRGKHSMQTVVSQKISSPAYDVLNCPVGLDTKEF